MAPLKKEKGKKKSNIRMVSFDFLFNRTYTLRKKKKSRKVALNF
jgi:hypothetical protein